jgi:hypothetical protein
MRRPPSRPAMNLSGDFSVRADGAWVGTCLAERTAWETFIFECRGLRAVELLHGTVVVAERLRVKEIET